MPNAYLLVEGKNDQHVIWALCQQHQLPETFSVEIPRSREGIEGLLDVLPVRLSARGLKALGVVVDADQDLLARWQALKDRLTARGHVDIPATPPASGWVSSQPELPRVGVWLMPDNQLPGMLEDFVRYLIPPDDALRPKAEAVLLEIEQAGLNRYKPVHRPKALIHSWLAWQENPGMPMGQAITAQVLHHNSPTANSFISWLKRLFDLPQ